VTRRRRQRGYTAVEVLSAMTLFAIGAAGVISMQIVTVKGGEDARRFDTATNIANEWISRLQRDAMMWTTPNQYQPETTNLPTTAWLSAVDTCPEFCNPPIPGSGNEPGRSPAFDLFGRDLPNDATEQPHVYCVQYRLNWLVPPGTAPTFNPLALMRAEIRVIWARLESAPIGNCASIDLSNPNRYHYVHAVTALRRNATR
jgi:prepilin-type N-terminal cleavage/methylation domain-containing protein